MALDLAARGDLNLSKDEVKTFRRFADALRDASEGTPVEHPEDLEAGLTALAAVGRGVGRTGESTEAATRDWHAGRLVLPVSFGTSVIVDGPSGQFDLSLTVDGRPRLGGWAAAAHSIPAVVLFDVRRVDGQTVVHLTSAEGGTVDVPIAATPWTAG